MGGIKKGVSCRKLSYILHLEGVYLFSLLLFIVDKMEIKKNLEIHFLNTRHIHDFHVPHVIIISYQKGYTVWEPSYIKFFLLALKFQTMIQKYCSLLTLTLQTVMYN